MRAKGTKGTVSIVDKKAVCFKRLWCCYEVYISLEQESDVLTQKDNIRYAPP